MLVKSTLRFKFFFQHARPLPGGGLHATIAYTSGVRAAGCGHQAAGADRYYVPAQSTTTLQTQYTVQPAAVQRTTYRQQAGTGSTIYHPTPARRTAQVKFTDNATQRTEHGTRRAIALESLSLWSASGLKSKNSDFGSALLPIQTHPVGTSSELEVQR